MEIVLRPLEYAVLYGKASYLHFRMKLGYQFENMYIKCLHRLKIYYVSFAEGQQSANIHTYKEYDDIYIILGKTHALVRLLR